MNGEKDREVNRDRRVVEIVGRCERGALGGGRQINESLHGCGKLEGLERSVQS